ncbi:hypothetical protein J4711_13790 [Staphylococcus epidermidis]|nr:hypothetical protein [Staphylococcus epidermidis]
MVDGLITSSATGADNKLFESLKYYYNVQAWIPKNLMTVRAKAFGALDKATPGCRTEGSRCRKERGKKSQRGGCTFPRHAQARRHAG